MRPHPDPQYWARRGDPYPEEKPLSTKRPSLAELWTEFVREVPEAASWNSNSLYGDQYSRWSEWRDDRMRSRLFEPDYETEVERSLRTGQPVRRSR
jgi:hypothetical protein